MAETTYLQGITEALREEMQRDQHVFLLGEDIGVYGGAFKVTKGHVRISKESPELEKAIFLENRETPREHQIAGQGKGDVPFLGFVKHPVPPF